MKYLLYTIFLVSNLTFSQTVINDTVNTSKKQKELIIEGIAKQINSKYERTYKRTGRFTNNIYLELYNVYATDNNIFVQIKITNEGLFNFNTSSPTFHIIDANLSKKRREKEKQIISSILEYNDEEQVVKPKEFIFKTYVFKPIYLSKDQFLEISFFDDRVLQNKEVKRINLYIKDNIINKPFSLDTNG